MKTPGEQVTAEYNEAKRSVGESYRSGHIDSKYAEEELDSIADRLNAAKSIIRSVKEKSLAEVREIHEELSKDFLLSSRSTDVPFGEKFTYLNRLAGQVHGLELIIHYRESNSENTVEEQER